MMIAMITIPPITPPAMAPGVAVEDEVVTERAVAVPVSDEVGEETFFPSSVLWSN